MAATEGVLATAGQFADRLLRPAASDVDRTGALSAGHLDAVAAAGLYGVAGPVDVGGAGADRGTVHQVTELLAAACLSTAFVLVQHQGVVSR
ncbi:MAG: acyl-CoA dehydrogenase family protein, partial [Sporichthyaceae bacterium]